MSKRAIDGTDDEVTVVTLEGELIRLAEIAKTFATQLLEKLNEQDEGVDEEKAHIESLRTELDTHIRTIMDMNEDQRKSKRAAVGAGGAGAGAAGASGSGRVRGNLLHHFDRTLSRLKSGEIVDPVTKTQTYAELIDILNVEMGCNGFREISSDKLVELSGVMKKEAERIAAYDDDWGNVQGQKLDVLKKNAPECPICITNKATGFLTCKGNHLFCGGCVDRLVAEALADDRQSGDDPNGVSIKCPYCTTMGKFVLF